MKSREIKNSQKEVEGFVLAFSVCVDGITCKGSYIGG